MHHALGVVPLPVTVFLLLLVRTIVPLVPVRVRVFTSGVLLGTAPEPASEEGLIGLTMTATWAVAPRCVPALETRTRAELEKMLVLPVSYVVPTRPAGRCH